MTDQQFAHSGDDDKSPTDTPAPPWIVTPPATPPWIVSGPSEAPPFAPPQQQTPPQQQPGTPPWLMSAPAPPVYATPPPQTPPSQVPNSPGTPPWLMSAPAYSTPAAAEPPSQMPDSPGTPPWLMTEQPSGPRSGGRRPILVAVLVLVVLLGGAGGAYYLINRKNSPQPIATAPATTQPTVQPTTDVPTTDVPTTDAPTTDPTESPTPFPSPTTQVADPQQTALAALDALSQKDLGLISLDGRYVAQIASKNPGTYDKYQTTASGSHTFQATDILAEYQRLHDSPANGGATVVLLKSTDFGKRQIYHGAPLYVTFALADFGSAGAVQSWCVKRFPSLSSAARADQCAARRLQPPA